MERERGREEKRIERERERGAIEKFAFIFSLINFTFDSSFRLDVFILSSFDGWNLLLPLDI
jgi:hypothetical protein